MNSHHMSLICIFLKTKNIHTTNQKQINLHFCDWEEEKGKSLMICSGNVANWSGQTSMTANIRKIYLYYKIFFFVGQLNHSVYTTCTIYFNGFILCHFFCLVFFFLFFSLKRLLFIEICYLKKKKKSNMVMESWAHWTVLRIAKTPKNTHTNTKHAAWDGHQQ